MSLKEGGEPLTVINMSQVTTMTQIQALMGRSTCSECIHWIILMVKCGDWYVNVSFIHSFIHSYLYLYIYKDFKMLTSNKSKAQKQANRKYVVVYYQHGTFYRPGKSIHYLCYAKWMVTLISNQKFVGNKVLCVRIKCYKYKISLLLRLIMVCKSNVM